MNAPQIIEADVVGVTVAAEIELPAHPIAEYRPLLAQLATLEAENKALVFDYRDKAGEKDARAHVAGLRKFRPMLAAARKSAKAEAKKITDLVDTAANTIEARLDAMIEVHDAPLKEIAAERKAKEDAAKAIVDRIVSLAANMAGKTRDELAALRDECLGLELVEESLGAHYSAACAAVIRSAKALGAAIAEADAAEQARRIEEQQRAEREAAAQAEREQQIREEAVRQEAARQEAETLRAKLAAEQAQREREAADQRARDAEARAAELEQQIIEASQTPPEPMVEQEKPEPTTANTADGNLTAVTAAPKPAPVVAADPPARDPAVESKAQINREVLEGFIAGGMDRDNAKLALTLLYRNQIPHCAINFGGN